MLIVFIVLSGIWITCGTVFVVREVEVLDETVGSETLSAAELNQISTSINLRGKNILFSVNQAKIAACVKNLDPMLKVQNVKVEFPNRVVVKVARRVPFYFDNKNYYDADLCLVENTKAGCINISGANLALRDGVKVGDAAVGADANNQCKIEQLRVVAAYIATERLPKDQVKEITFKEDKYLRLQIALLGGDSWQIRTQPGDNFNRLFVMMCQVYFDEKQKAHGEYRALYQDDGKACVTFVDDNNEEREIFYEK